MMKAENFFAAKIVEWYQSHQRILPWRATQDPYRIWLSEIILQQTRVDQGLPYYLKFVERFPDVGSLASAKQDEVLRFWQGLGYYSRARNLHRCSGIIVDRYKGSFPSSLEELESLPGIGNYTAAAIASIAFQRPVAAVDGNAYRVLSRFFGIEADVSSSEGQKLFREFANRIIPPGEPGAFNQGIMDLGATLCLPGNPECERCVLAPRCVAKLRGLQHQLPVKRKRLKKRKRFFHYFVLKHRSKLLMKKRNAKDIWQGLYDFYLIEATRRTSALSLAREDKYLKGLLRQGDKINSTPAVRHVLTHQEIWAAFTVIEVGEKTKLGRIAELTRMKLYTSSAVEQLPKPVPISKFLSTAAI